MVGSGIGAVKGVLIRNGEALQRMKDIRVMVFDKTGTLTHGKPEVIKILSYNFDENELLRLGCSLEAASEHPLALAIVKAAKARSLSPAAITDFQSTPGKGIVARINQESYLMGNQEFLKEQQIELKAALIQLPVEQYPHATQVFLAKDKQVLGCFLIADTVKPEAAQVVKDLQAMGIRSVMLSGDDISVAKAIANQCGIEQVLANILPADKAVQIRNLQNQCGAVAMVGDGINDAPALKQADIGIAMGQGTDIAMEAADITIVRSELTALITAIRLSRETFKKIRQNLFWAFFYNLIAIPLAVLGLLHPVIAEMAMASSSVTVVTNANLLRKKQL
jgi:Cu+-exporting ATPase